MTVARALSKQRKTGYLFQRPGSANWWIKLQSPGKRIEKSLGTPDRRQAEILALPMIAEHKARLLAARPHLMTVWQHRLEPGREHAAPDGGKIIAAGRELIYVGHNGVITRTEPNGGLAQRTVAFFPTQATAIVAARRAVKWGVGVKPDARPKLAPKTGDDAILETYLKHRNVTGAYEREARSVWALYRTLTDGKPLKDADRDDGRKLVVHFEGEGLRSASIRKKVGWLNAAVNFAIKEGRLKFNPFSSIVPERDDEQRRLPLSEADMKACKRNLEALSETDQLLFRLLASTGMRLSEAFEIEGEMKERGCRYVIVGKKTEQSKRRVPLAAAVLPYLPKSIKGPIFKGSIPAGSKRLNRFLNDCGIGDAHKVLHSLRHRAQDRLRAAGCPEDIRWALLGHEEKTVAAGYGEGFPVPMLKKWIDKIGC